MKGRLTALAALAIGIAVGVAWPDAPAPSEGIAGIPTDRPSSAFVASATPTLNATQRPTQAPALGSAPVGPTESATVLSITDGDTIRVDRGFGSEPVRFIGIDAPEVGVPGSAEATAETARLLEGMQVVLEKDVSETDSFDRLLRYVWIDTGGGWTFVNLELLRRGLVRAGTYPPDVRFDDLFVAAERTARSRILGLWAPPPPPTPAPEPTPAPVVTEAPASCHPSYDPCLPIVDDLDCADIRAMGAAPVTVTGPDSYRLDGDGDGIGCE